MEESYCLILLRAVIIRDTRYSILDNPNYRISGLQFIENRVSSIENPISSISINTIKKISILLRYAAS